MVSVMLLPMSYDMSDDLFSILLLCTDEISWPVNEH